MSTQSDLVLTIFTLNVWGIAFVSKNRSQRIEAIATALSSGRYDVVCLQEVWVVDDYEKIKHATRSVLPYSHYFYSGVTGSGLCIFSRWPIEDIMFHQWPVNGYVHKIFHGDWFGGKGVGLCHISTNGIHINIYTTHLHAQYDAHDDEYLAHRAVQAFDTAQFIRLTADGAHLSVLAGDLNTHPGNLCHQLIQHCAQLEDTFHKQPAENQTGTFDCSRNSYAVKSNVMKNPNGERIDYILYRAGLNAQVDVLEYSMPLQSRVPEQEFSYSDHEGIAATIRVTPQSPEISMPSCYIKDRGAIAATLKAGITTCADALNKLAHDKVWYLGVAGSLLVSLFSIPAFTEIPVTYSRTYQLTLVGTSGVIFFTMVMATIWNRMEYNGILGGQMRMQVVLDRVTDAYDSVDIEKTSMTTGSSNTLTQPFIES